MKNSRRFGRTLSAYAALLLGMAFFGTGTPTTKIVVSGFPMFLAPFLRLLTAAVLTTPILWIYRDEVRKISRKSWGYIAAIGAIGLVAFSIFLLSGMQMVNGVVGAMVMSLSPAAVAVGASLYLHDKLGWRKWTAVISSVAGVIVINVTGESVATGSVFELVTGSLLVFGAVCSATLYSLFAKRVSQSVRPILLVPLAGWIATFLFAGPGLFQATGFDFERPTMRQWLALSWWGIGPFGIGTMLWFWGLKSVKASTASGFMGAMPATGLLVSYFVLGDQFHWIHLLGFALVIAGIAMVSWAHSVNERKAREKNETYSPPHACPC